MPINWNNENSSKLLIAIVQQVRANAIKLDYNQLATHMGPGCSVNAIRAYMGRVGKSVEENSSNMNSDGASPTRKSTPTKKATRAPRIPRKRKLDEVNDETPVKTTDGGPTLPVVKTEAELLGIKVEKDDIKIETCNDSEVNLTDLEDFDYENYDIPLAGTTDLLVSATELDV